MLSERPRPEVLGWMRMAPDAPHSSYPLSLCATRVLTRTLDGEALGLVAEPAADLEPGAGLCIPAIVANANLGRRGPACRSRCRMHASLRR